MTAQTLIEERINLQRTLTDRNGWNITIEQLEILEQEGEKRYSGTNEVLRDVLQALKNGYDIKYITHAFFSERLGHPHFIYISSNTETRKDIFRNGLTPDNKAEKIKFVIDNHYLTASQVSKILDSEKHPDDSETSSSSSEEKSNYYDVKTMEQDPYAPETLGEDSAWDE